MPSGTPVRAARGGVVVGARDDSDVGGADTKFEREANFILIQHSDGTLGHYVHLSKGGNRVRIGQAVQTGDWIGLSGNTGHSTGPHLHFSIFKARNGKQRQTIPVRFKTSNSTATTLVRGRAYKSPGTDAADAVASHKNSETPAVGAP
jgi:murein DD-endopeptidase MepM/ murein hydrolase activator NlpD